MTRLQVQQKASASETTLSDDSQYAGLQDAIQKTYRNEGGLPAFYAGITQDTIKSVTDSFLFFLFYNSLFRARHKQRSDNRKSIFIRLVDEVGVGILAGAATRAVTAPIQQVITRKQTMAVTSAVSSKDGKPHALGREEAVADILRQIYQTNGLPGFWAGYSATIILTLNPSLTMSIDSFLRRLAAKRVVPGPTVTFLLAAISKGTAGSITYPVALAKTRAQASSLTASEKSPDSIKPGPGGPGSVLSIISQIARKDGPQALYAGLGGEVVKGFFSHGLTMLVKHKIHASVIQLYFSLVKHFRQREAARIP